MVQDHRSGLGTAGPYIVRAEGPGRLADPEGSSLPAADPPVGRLTWRLAEIAQAIGVSRRALERERSAGRLPSPDLTLGRMPLWRPESIRAWIERGGRP